MVTLLIPSNCWMLFSVSRNMQGAHALKAWMLTQFQIILKLCIHMYPGNVFFWTVICAWPFLFFFFFALFSTSLDITISYSWLSFHTFVNGYQGIQSEFTWRSSFWEMKTAFRIMKCYILLPPENVFMLLIAFLPYFPSVCTWDNKTVSLSQCKY